MFGVLYHSSDTPFSHDIRRHNTLPDRMSYSLDWTFLNPPSSQLSRLSFFPSAWMGNHRYVRYQPLGAHKKLLASGTPASSSTLERWEIVNTLTGSEAGFIKKKPWYASLFERTFLCLRRLTTGRKDRHDMRLCAWR